ncbi:2-dehydropantoate 2-reductase N-terminal domain-containing protein [Nonomuraea fuscirosea]|uniref:2-dehydropantoate 2-reductase N-terminal domain-containing protein n=1 Tax=Nonomuraea fuscirosea TaxID=1291556 RepID=UPI003798944C
MRIGVIGYGSVGSLLGRSLAADGADVVVADRDDRLRRPTTSSPVTRSSPSCTSAASRGSRTRSRAPAASSTPSAAKSRPATNGKPTPASTP